MVRCTSPGGCTCAITGRMHAVCDEHSSHSFKSDGSPEKRPWMQEVISDKEKENRRVELGGHQHLNARGILARTPCRHCPHSVPCSFGFLSDRRRQPDFEDRKRTRQEIPSLMAENGNSCTTCAYLSPTLGFFAPFYYCHCLCPYDVQKKKTWDELAKSVVINSSSIQPCECEIVQKTRTKVGRGDGTVPVQGLPIRDCEGSCNSWVPKHLKVGAIDVTSKSFFERSLFVPGLSPFEARVKCPCVLTPPPFSPHWFLDFRFPSFFLKNILEQHNVQKKKNVRRVRV